ncbi:hypothetical protein FM119_03970 [Mycetocola reblochoni REB411]|uniref:Uncharacterized protein n=1 Tax=Mycetocola reblochoni REB411 TaxID=1255698 RepID=A0A1R4IWW1_9MICO|nr:hypothetical protein FM119_03970 [Mycetocola reblochoni REB411]
MTPEWSWLLVGGVALTIWACVLDARTIGQRIRDRQNRR